MSAEEQSLLAGHEFGTMQAGLAEQEVLEESDHLVPVVVAVLGLGVGRVAVVGAAAGAAHLRLASGIVRVVDADVGVGGEDERASICAWNLRSMSEMRRLNSRFSGLLISLGLALAVSCSWLDSERLR